MISVKVGLRRDTERGQIGNSRGARLGSYLYSIPVTRVDFPGPWTRELSVARKLYTCGCSHVVSVGRIPKRFSTRLWPCLRLASSGN